MPRPRAENGLARVLAAAEEVFGELGFRDANIADIAKAAGVGPGTIYRLFDNKAALFQWTLLRARSDAIDLPTAEPIREVRDFERHLWTLFDVAASFPSLNRVLSGGRGVSFETIVREHLEFQSSQARWLDIVEVAAETDDETHNVWFRGIVGPLLDRTTTAIEAYQRRGVVDRAWPAAAAAHFIITNASFFARNGHRRYAVLQGGVDSYRDQLVAQICRGLGRTPTVESRDVFAARLPAQTGWVPAGEVLTTR